MAREAGIDAEKDTLCRYEGWLEPLKVFEALVRADEREECSKLIEAETGMNPDWQKHLADAIRARGNT
jgi:hypothetical protein